MNGLSCRLGSTIILMSYMMEGRIESERILSMIPRFREQLDGKSKRVLYPSLKYKSPHECEDGVRGWLDMTV